MRATLQSANTHNGKLKEQAIDLLCNLLVLNPAKRLSAKDAFGVSLLCANPSVMAPGFVRLW